MKITRSLLALTIAAALSACGGGSSNNAPEFSSASYSFSGVEDSLVTGTVVATDSDEVTYTVASAASNGVIALESDGSFTFTPNADFFGEDQVTIQASDGSKQSEAEVTFTITNVNDAPVLTTTSIGVTTSGISEVTLDASDVDGDEVTFTLVESPANGTLTLSSSGELTYQADELDNISGSFTVSYTDGIIDTPIEATIELSPAFITSEDKRNYYYSSTLSHLNKAEAIKATIDDDTISDEINIELVAAYVLAGYSEKEASTFAEISTVEDKAYAYRSAALSLDVMNDSDSAISYRNLAEENYNLYMAEKGLDNVASTDASFYQNLIGDFNNEGQFDEARQLIARVNLYAEAVREDEYNTAWGRFLTAAWSTADDMVTAYLENPTEDDLLLAVEAVSNYAEMNKKTGYADYRDEPAETIKSLYHQRASEHFYLLGEEELAKEYTALHIALYTNADYDENYTFTASDYAAGTSGYAYPLVTTSGIYEALYPDDETNFVYTTLENLGASDWYLSSATGEMLSSEIINDIKSGTSVADATQSAKDEFVVNLTDVEEYFSALVESHTSQPKAARILYRDGYSTEAIEILNDVSNVVTSDDYLSTAPYNVYSTGWKGCARITDLLAVMEGDAVSQAAICADVVNDYFSLTSEIYTTDEVIDANRDLITTYGFVDDLTGISSAAANMQAAANILEELEGKLTSQLDVAGYLMMYGLFDESRTSLDYALATISEIAASDDTEVLEEAISDIAGSLLKMSYGEELDSYHERFGYLYTTKLNALEIPSYDIFYADLITVLQEKVNELTTKALTLSDENQLDMMSDLIAINFQVGLYDQVEALIASDVNGDADKLALNQELAAYYAEMDDLPGSLIASVDTDHDGLPNFFIAGATQEEIDASGFTLDEDSDNDGIPDTDDLTPLGDE